ncbi:hypothetical protein BDR22DRAFT_884895 [Usnea florida]
MSETVISGAIVSIKKLETGDKEPDTYEVRQLHLQRGIPSTREPFSWSFGPFEATGYIDVEKREFGITVSVLGITIGTYVASFDQGFTIDFTVLLANGQLKFYVKDNALWVRIDVDIAFDDSYHTDVKIVDF